MHELTQSKRSLNPAHGASSKRVVKQSEICGSENVTQDYNKTKPQFDNSDVAAETIIENFSKAPIKKLPSR